MDALRRLVERFRRSEKEIILPRVKIPRITRKARLEALKKESDLDWNDGMNLAERDRIRRLLALPMEKRTHFLRKRVGLRMACL